MTAPSETAARESRPIESPQDGLWRVLFMFLWPAVWYTFLIYGVLARFVPEGGKAGTGVVLLVTVLGPGAELLAGLLLLRREGYRMGDGAWRERIRWRWPNGIRSWLLAIVIFVLAFGLSNAAGPLSRTLANTPGFVPPEWWPAASDPRADVESAADAFPDVELQGNVMFLLVYTLIGLLFNIFGEEIYYRGYLLPRMNGTFGGWAWAANGVLFTLKHVYQRWLYPGILIGGLAFAFAAGPLGSLPLAMIFHWVGNELFKTVFLVLATFGRA